VSLEFENDLLFVSIGADRDPRLNPTIRNCLAKVHNPARLRFGICRRHGADELPPPYTDNRHRIMRLLLPQPPPERAMKVRRVTALSMSSVNFLSTSYLFCLKDQAIPAAHSCITRCLDHEPVHVSDCGKNRIAWKALTSTTKVARFRLLLSAAKQLNADTTHAPFH
jgi:Glycosyltransferase (GlcNAc)